MISGAEGSSTDFTLIVSKIRRSSGVGKRLEIYVLDCEQQVLRSDPLNGIRTPWPRAKGRSARGYQRRPTPQQHPQNTATNLLPAGQQEAKKDLQLFATSPCQIRRCERQELNLHRLPHWILSPARLPIPPLSAKLFHRNDLQFPVLFSSWRFVLGFCPWNELC